MRSISRGPVLTQSQSPSIASTGTAPGDHSRFPAHASPWIRPMPNGQSRLPILSRISVIWPMIQARSSSVRAADNTGSVTVAYSDAKGTQGGREVMLLRQPAGDRLAAGNLLGGVLAVGNASDRLLRREQVDRIAVMVDQ